MNLGTRRSKSGIRHHLGLSSVEHDKTLIGLHCDWFICLLMNPHSGSNIARQDMDTAFEPLAIADTAAAAFAILCGLLWSDPTHPCHPIDRQKVHLQPAFVILAKNSSSCIRKGMCQRQQMITCKVIFRTSSQGAFLLRQHHRYPAANTASAQNIEVGKISVHRNKVSPASLGPCREQRD